MKRGWSAFIAVCVLWLTAIVVLVAWVFPSTEKRYGSSGANPNLEALALLVAGGLVVLPLAAATITALGRRRHRRP